MILSTNEYRIEYAIKTILLIVAALIIYRVADNTLLQFSQPHDLVFESPNVQTIELIRRHENPYAETSYNDPPFVITLYTPIFHYIVSSFPQLDGNIYGVGRMVSAISMFMAAFGLLLADRKSKWFGFVAFVTFFSLWFVISNTAFVKNDPLALLFSVSAVICIYRGKSSYLLVFAGVLCVAAVMTKQSYFSATLSCSLYLLLTRPRDLIPYFLGMFVSSIFVLCIVYFYWGPGFWFSTIFALGQPVTFSHAIDVLFSVYRQPAAMLITFSFLSVSTVRFHKLGKATLVESPYLLYSIFSLLLVTFTLGKEGSSNNYFFEIFMSQLLYLVSTFSKREALPKEKNLARLGVLMLSLIVFFDIASTDQRKYSFASVRNVAMKKETIDKLNSELVRLGYQNPKILDLGFSVFVSALSTSTSLNDPYHYSMMWRDGILKPDAMANSVEEQFYDIILIPLYDGQTSNRAGFLTVEEKIYTSISESYTVSATIPEWKYALLTRKQ